MNLDQLTPQERRVFDRLALGESNCEIATAVKCGEATVRGHMKSIFEKLGATSRAKLIANYYRGL